MRQLSLRLHQLARALDERFTRYVHHEGIDEKKPDMNRLRSRGLAAMAAHMVAGISDHDAAQRVTDHYHDDGIDGFAIDTPPSLLDSATCGPCRVSEAAPRFKSL